MEHYILASHGELAYGMKTAVEMIEGKNDNISSYDLEHYENPDKIKKIIESSIKENMDDIYIIFTDLLGGSIQNSLFELAQYENTVVISGMHLGLVLMMISESGTYTRETLQDKADSAVKSTISMITAYTSKKIKKEINLKDDEI